MIPLQGDPSVLDAFLGRFDAARALRVDPVRFPRRFSDHQDVEVAGLIAALLAFGRVAAIGVSVEAVLRALGDHPARRLRVGAEASWAPEVSRLGHRWVRGPDLVSALGAVGDALRLDDSLEASLARHRAPDRREDAAGPAGRWLAELRDVARARRGTASRGLDFLLAGGAPGSALKRPLLFLRWMVRRGSEGVDLGLWRVLAPRQLVIPLDTHVFRIGRALGLTARRTPDLKAAREITASLARLDPEDPLKYDFALCHLGVAGRCFGRRIEGLCTPCPLQAACRLDGAGGTAPRHAVTLPRQRRGPEVRP